jgi:hypothetical protein
LASLGHGRWAARSVAHALTPRANAFSEAKQAMHDTRSLADRSAAGRGGLKVCRFGQVVSPLCMGGSEDELSPRTRLLPDRTERTHEIASCAVMPGGAAAAQSEHRHLRPAPPRGHSNRKLSPPNLLWPYGALWLGGASCSHFSFAPQNRHFSLLVRNCWCPYTHTASDVYATPLYLHPSMHPHISCIIRSILRS